MPLAISVARRVDTGSDLAVLPPPRNEHVSEPTDIDSKDRSDGGKRPESPFIKEAGEEGPEELARFTAAHDNALLELAIDPG